MQALNLKIDSYHSNELSLISQENLSLEEKIKRLIIRDLLNLEWTINFNSDNIIIAPPSQYDKDTIKKSMSFKRNEIISNQQHWIEKKTELAKFNLAHGCDVLKSKIIPKIEVCQTKQQHDLFRILRYYWSSPYSEYVGRRIKIIVRDYGLPSKPVIGICALGSPIIHIPERDNWIGWDKNARTQNLNYTMDAYVIGALPPYSHLLGGKLISYILASKEVRLIYRNKYKNRKSIINKKSSSKLIGIFTTGLYGKSSQYNRLKFQDELLYIPIGSTKGFGSLHLSIETINSMVQLLREKDINISNEFGSGPSWIMRVIRACGDLLNFDSDFLLQHSFRRSIYFVPLAYNYKDVLNGYTQKADYTNYSMASLVKYWKNRWLYNRLKNDKVIERVRNFKPENFLLED